MPRRRKQRDGTLGALTTPYDWVRDVLARAEAATGTKVTGEKQAIGCGGNGCVFDVGLSQTLKITRDPDEVELFKRAWKDRVPGVVPYQGVMPVKISDDIGFGHTSDTNEAWAILKPAVDPLPGEVSDADLDDLGHAAVRFLRAKGSKERRQARERYGLALTRVERAGRYPEVAQTLRDWYRAGVLAGDVSPSNIGLYEGRHVLYDGQILAPRRRKTCPR